MIYIAIDNLGDVYSLYSLFIRVILGLDAPLQKGFLVWRVHICIIFWDNTNVFWPALRKMTCACVFQVCH
jgi:hypothetical protein